MHESRSPADRSLDQTLADWRVTPHRNPQFRTEVWDQIAAAKPASWPAYARLHAAALMGGLALALVIGALAGREEAKSRVAAERDAIAREYVQALDARTMRP